MSSWVNRTVLAGASIARNGTTSHTCSFTAASAGSLLVAVVAGAVTFTTPVGWTLTQSSVNNSGVYVFTKTASAAESSFSTTHNGSNYPIFGVVYECATGSSVIGADHALSQSDASASCSLTGLTGTYTRIGVNSQAMLGTSDTASVTWTTPTVEDYDVSTPAASSTDGIALSIAYDDGATGGTFALSRVVGGSHATSNNEVIVLTLAVVAGGGSFTGTLAKTQGNNTSAAAGTLGYTGTAAGTQGGNTASASGTFTPAGISGSLARTQGDNAASASGVVHPVGAVAATQGNNAGAAAGVLGYAGTLARTQGNGTVAASGTFTPSGVSGSVAIGQAANTATAAGVVHPVGAVAVTQANSTIAAAGTLGYVGSLAKAQANGTLAASGTFIGLVTGTLAKTQGGNTLAASGTFAASITGTLARGQANNACAASGSVQGAFTALPPDRTLIVAAESRTFAPIESRTFTSLAESRVLEVA